MLGGYILSDSQTHEPHFALKVSILPTSADCLLKLPYWESFETSKVQVHSLPLPIDAETPLIKSGVYHTVSTSTSVVSPCAVHAKDRITVALELRLLRKLPPGTRTVVRYLYIVIRGLGPDITE